jgi:hypothetical protein
MILKIFSKILKLKTLIIKIIIIITYNMKNFLINEIFKKNKEIMKLENNLKS